jgi:hypothetical protein
MAVAQPIATDPLNNPDHSVMHRIIACDVAATAKIFQIDSADNVCIGDADLANYIKIASGGVMSIVGTANIPGFKHHMGVEAIGAVTFVDATHILSVASITYWYNGVKYTTASPTTCDIDDYVAIANNTVYLFYFDASAGLLKCQAGITANFFTQVPVAAVFWNGTNGAIQKEWHSSTRDLDWHTWGHDTVGIRYETGLNSTLPTTGDDNHLSIAGGTIMDEDLELVISNPQTTCRVLYQVSSGVYTWVNSALPYAGSGTQPQYLDTDTWALTNVGASDFACMWVYATSDQDRPIYIIPTHATNAYNTIALARSETQPNLATLNLSPEMKLLWKFIYKGDGNFQEKADYRTVISLPGGGVTNIGASAVTFIPSGSIVAADVQNALVELDTEKAAVGQTFYIGTTQVAINRASATLNLAGIGTFDCGAITSSGLMTVNNGAVFNEASDDVDFRVESNNNANMFFVDGGADCVTIGYNGNLGATFNVYNATSNTTQFTGNHLNIRGGGGATNSISEISFGIGGYTNKVCVVGSKVIDGTGSTKSNFYIGLRNVTTDTAPTEVFRIDTTGLTNCLFGLNVAGTATFNNAVSGITTLGCGTVTTSGYLYLSGNNEISRDTTDGTDNGYMYIAGGGASGVTRGSWIGLAGNENTSYYGDLLLYAGNSGQSGHGGIVFATGNAVTRLTIDNAGLSTFTADIKANSTQYVLEGYATGRNVLRGMAVQIQPGATPGTDIDINDMGVAYGGFNSPTNTNANDLAKSGTSGSWTMSADGKIITFNVTPAIISCLGVSLGIAKINTGTGTYTILHTISSANINFTIYATGSTTSLDWTTLLDAGDYILMNFNFTTST